MMIFRKCKGPDHPQVGDLLLNLAGTELSAGQLATAEKHATAALAIFTKHLSPDSHKVEACRMTLTMVQDRMTAERDPDAVAAAAAAANAHGGAEALFKTYTRDPELADRAGELAAELTRDMDDEGLKKLKSITDEERGLLDPFARYFPSTTQALP